MLEQTLRRRLLSQAATAFAWVIGVGFAAMAAGVAATGDPREAGIVLRGALGWLTWLCAGAIVLAATGPMHPDDHAVDDLAALRGLGARSLSFGRAWAVGRRVLRATAAPALLVALAPWPFVRSASSAAAAGSNLVGTALYLILLGTLSGFLVFLSRWLAPSRSRWALAAVVFLPEVIRSLVTHFPSVPRVLSACRELATRTEGWFS